ncbi:MAG: hypothetical protein COA79_20705 [Planctomycetota bacterium]|nr:MAG: hypothetical protein COA79_20705 [Planctomycetota bacterium]
MIQPYSKSKINKQPHIGVNTEEARSDRISYLYQKGHQLESYHDTSYSCESVKSNIESYIGTMSIPVGLVGPLLYKTDENEIDEVFSALATTEGALVSSMNRGVSVLNNSGGFRAHVSRKCMLRVPMFCFNDLDQAKYFCDWLKNQFEELNEYIKGYSKRAQLINIETQILGKDVNTKFYYHTGDAAGQNMTSICTWHACLWIEKKFNSDAPFKILDYVLDANGSSDKKITHDSILNGRGVEVVAECLISEEVLKKKLKVSSKEMMIWYNKSTFVATNSGMIGYNVNIANSIAAIFTATGQDIGSVHESAVGFLFFEPHNDGLYVCLKLPRLVIGTIGGGTSLSSQKENLELMGCYGSEKVTRFAELICGFSLALEISTFAAMANGQFALAHERLGRNKPVNNLKFDENINSFLTSNVLENKKMEIKHLKHLNNHNGIITELTAKNSTKFIGLSKWEVNRNGLKSDVILKSKPTDSEILNCMYLLTGFIDPQLAKTFCKCKETSDFKNTPLKEIEIYKQLNSVLDEHTPQLHGSYHDDEREINLILMEYLNPEKMKIFNSENENSIWNDHLLKITLIANIKSLKNISSLKTNSIFQSSCPNDFILFTKHSFEVLKDEYEENNICDIFNRVIEELTCFNSSKHFETIIHNDFNPRNIAITSSEKVKIYDWELARIDLPQRDLIELLVFIYNSPNILMPLNEIIDFYRLHFCEEFEVEINTDLWLKGLKYSFAKFVGTRLNLYMLGNKITEYKFIETVFENVLLIENELNL